PDVPVRIGPSRVRRAGRRGRHAPQPAAVRELRGGGTHDARPGIQQPAVLEGAASMADRSFELLTEAIVERDQPRTADLFFRMMTREGRALGDALDVVTAAEAPFVQVPSHIN